MAERIENATSNTTSKAAGRHGLTLSDEQGQSVRLTPYGDYIMRVQIARPGETFLPDDQYDMVTNHSWKNSVQFQKVENGYRAESSNKQGIKVDIPPDGRGLRFSLSGEQESFLSEGDGVVWSGSQVSLRFKNDPEEHFCGLGHGFYGRVDTLDLKGKTIERNYGEQQHGRQGPLLVPFYLSSKGYGVFLNSTFPNRFVLGGWGHYEIGIDDYGYGGQLDYFVIVGPGFSKIIDRYTQLTGRPRLPQKLFFGLHLSDKGYPDNEGEAWWKSKVAEHRAAGYPLDHIANDNRWRSGSGAWEGSWFEWSPERYPDPAQYKKWCDEQGLVATVDLNMNICNDSWGWKDEYNYPNTEGMAHADSMPDYSNPKMRKWVWELFWKKTLDPKLGYPGDALWIDETDEIGGVSMDSVLGSGRRQAEEKNYYLFRIAQAFVEEGWEKDIGDERRPFVWIRGGCAGAQRYATHWTGDIDPTYQEMKLQLRGMLASGLSGFPYFNHDAGGFHHGPDDEMYQQWAMAFGSFTPIWRPHGPGLSRWPMDRSQSCQEVATRYTSLRYEMMPYIYTYAHEAQRSGAPMARPMVFDYQDQPEAWAADLQYMWGGEMIVAPSFSGEAANVKIWLPPGNDWIDFWTHEKYSGGQTLEYQAEVGRLPVFVKAGAIIPKREYAMSTAWLKKDHLVIDVYPGADGTFLLIEDDDTSEKYRTENECSETKIQYSELEEKLTIHPVAGTYTGQPKQRSYTVRLLGKSGKNESIEVKAKPITETTIVSLR